VAKDCNKKITKKKDLNLSEQIVKSLADSCLTRTLNPASISCWPNDGETQGTVYSGVCTRRCCSSFIRCMASSRMASLVARGVVSTLLALFVG
jgi:hypothetical protein